MPNDELTPEAKRFLEQNATSRKLIVLSLLGSIGIAISLYVAIILNQRVNLLIAIGGGTLTLTIITIILIMQLKKPKKKWFK